MVHDLCFKSLTFCNPYICYSCYQKFDNLSLKIKLYNYEVFILYRYNDFLKSLIYQYKGCYDIEIAPIFLSVHLKKLQNKYADYIVVYPPSNQHEIEKRGFDHMKEIVRSLQLPIMDIFYKSIDYKQSNASFEARNQIQNVIQLKTNHNLKNAKILLIDDIFTSGNTIKRCIKLLINNVPNLIDLKIICICKTDAKKVEI